MIADADLTVHVGEYCEPFSPDGKKLRQKIRRKQKKESSDDDGLDHADSFTRPASPTGSTATELMSDYEDDKTMLAASFTSCGTQPTHDASRPSRVMLQPKHEDDVSNMHYTNQESDMQPTRHDTFPYHHDNDFSRHSQPSITIPPIWPPTTASHDGQFTTPYQMDLMTSQAPSRVAVPNPFAHNDYSSQFPTSTNTDMSMMGYHDPESVHYDYMPPTMKNVPYNPASCMVHDVRSSQGFTLQAHYADPYGSRQ